MGCELKNNVFQNQEKKEGVKIIVHIGRLCVSKLQLT